MKSGIIILLLAALGGCVNLGGEQRPSTTYLLTDAHIATPNAHPQAHTLMVAPMRSSSFDDNDALVFANTANTRGRYQLARWSQRPSSRLGELLFNRLIASQIYTSIAHTDSDIVADRLLTTELLSLYHDASTQPGQVKISVRATLYDNQQHSLLARKTFEQTVPVATFNAAGAASAFNIASTQLIDDMLTWLTPAAVSSSSVPAHSH
ncbi:MAG: hypothetical protein HOP20_01310 [Sulfuriferula sp.]|nr:hypothetical protein [Sulfuriferula sp.]